MSPLVRVPFLFHNQPLVVESGFKYDLHAKDAKWKLTGTWGRGWWKKYGSLKLWRATSTSYIQNYWYANSLFNICHIDLSFLDFKNNLKISTPKILNFKCIQCCTQQIHSSKIMGTDYSDTNFTHITRIFGQTGLEFRRKSESPLSQRLAQN